MGRTKSTERDYVQEVRKLIDARMVDGFIAAVLAGELVDRLRSDDPELLRGFLDAMAVNTIREHIGHINRSARSYTRRTDSRGVFGEAAKKAEENGDTVTLRTFLDIDYVIDVSGKRRKLGDLVHSDLVFVAEDYHQRAQSNKLEAAFFHALAKKVKAGGGSVSDYFDADQVKDLYDSITGVTHLRVASASTGTSGSPIPAFVSP